MSSANNEEKSNRLARVRENQRRSRARKQQYIEELERKVAACNAQAQQKDIEHRIAVQKLEIENANLRGLLNRVGIDNGYLEEYLKQCSDPATSAKVAIPSLKKQSSCQQSSSSSPKCTPAAGSTPKHCIPSPSTTGESDCNCISESDCSPVPNVVANPVATEHFEASIPLAPVVANQVPAESDAPDSTRNQVVRLPPITSICDCGPGSANFWPEDENPLNSTLCGIAEDLVHRFNTRGVDINMIKQMLWSGFRNDGSAGCRVKNNVLFEVLDELSGNIP